MTGTSTFALVAIVSRWYFRCWWCSASFGGVLRLLGGVLCLLGGVLRLLGVVLLLRSRHVSRVNAGRNWMVGECALGPTRSKSKAQIQGNHPSIRAQIKGIHPLHPKP